MSSMLISQRFCGPEDSGNGGYSSGLLAKALLKKHNSAQAVQVRLNAPPPLDTQLDITYTEQSVCLLHQQQPIARATLTENKLTPPPLADQSILAALKSPSIQEKHLLPYCFVCGPKRNTGDGLRIFSQNIGKHNVAALWTPDISLGEKDSALEEEFIWAALDCPGYSAHQINQLMLLGTITAQVFEKPNIGQTLIIVAQHTRSDGRKHYSNSAIYDNKGKCYAASTQLWISLT